MRGSVFKRCQCRDDDGGRVKNCRLAHGSWAYAIDTGPDAATGKRKQKVRSGFKTRQDAEHARAKELAAVLAGTWTDDQGVTVGEWLQRWLEELTERGLSPKTLANYRGHVRDVWQPAIGRLRLRELRRCHIERVLTGLRVPVPGERRVGNVGRRVSIRTTSTIAGYRRTIRAGLAAAVRRELLAINPAEGRLDALASSDHEEDDSTFWEPEETAKFLEHVSDDPLAALYEVASYAGLRRAELCGLRWSDIDADGAGLTVRQTVVEVSRGQLTDAQRVCPYCAGEHVGRFFKRPKSRAGRRWVPLAGPAQAALARHRAAQAKDQALFGPDYRDHDLVFCLPDGTPLRPGSVTNAFESHVRECGLPVVRLHDTRHGACSLLLAGGVPIEVVQMILGHSTPEITRRVYAHLVRKVAADQVETAAELLTKHRRSATGPVSNP